MSIFSDYENGYMDNYEYREECKRMNIQDRYERDHEFDEPDEEDAEKMTNEEMLDKVLRHFFPRALFIREINEESHTKKIIFTDEWLKKPYKGGE